VYVRLNGLEAESTVDAGYFYDWCDSLQIFVENRGNWPNEAAHSHVLQRIQATRVAFGGHFKGSPSAFELLTPADGETLSAANAKQFSWSNATYTEPGDRIWYRLAISADTTFTGGYLSPPLDEDQLLLQVPLPADQTYWWRVVAQERGGHTTLSTPAARQFRLASGTSGVISPPVDGSSTVLPSPGLAVWPNPATDQVHFQWSRSSAGPGAFEIFDTGGRLVRRLDCTIATAPTASPGGCPTGEWDGVDAQGHALASGLYWVRWAPAGSAGPRDAATDSSPARFLLLR
jgi:hypothetical protein